MLVCTLLLLCSPQVSSAAVNPYRSVDPYAALADPCDKYDKAIRKSVATHWPDFNYPVLWKAQLKQESLCNPNAVSPVGARGIAQFMPGTARDVERWRKQGFDPLVANLAIENGAYLMARYRRFWKTPRPEYERHKLTAASYNAGPGNIAKSQKRCGNPSDYEDIMRCLPQITGRHARETQGYWPRIAAYAEGWAQGRPWLLPPDMRNEIMQRDIAKVAGKIEIRRLFDGTSWCTYWRLWGGWASADHCYQGRDRKAPPWASPGRTAQRDGSLDAVLFDVTFPARQPRRMREGEPVWIVSYPGGSGALTLREGVGYIRRQSGEHGYEVGNRIVIIPGLSQWVDDVRYDPVIGGMSGGLVVSKQLDPLAILVTQNGQAELTGDGVNDNSADVVELHDVWRELRHVKPVR